VFDDHEAASVVPSTQGYLHVKLHDRDHVDRVREQWAGARPDLDTTPIAIVARVGRLTRYFDRGHARVFADYGLRRDTWDVLASLRRSGPPYRLTPTEIYRGLMRSSGAVSNRLRRLEDAGLVSRLGDPTDGRGVQVQLTERGLDLVDAAAPAHMDNERTMLAALTPDEQDQLAGLLRKLLLAFETAPHTGDSQIS
jgi:DNA-binding MarR family transcriptional regulator